MVSLKSIRMDPQNDQTGTNAKECWQWHTILQFQGLTHITPTTSDYGDLVLKRISILTHSTPATTKELFKKDKKQSISPVSSTLTTPPMQARSLD